MPLNAVTVYAKQKFIAILVTGFYTSGRNLFPVSNPPK